MTTVKNNLQAASTSYGEPVGTQVPIAAPPNVDPQALVNSFGSVWTNGWLPFAMAWKPGGPNDYKLQNPMFDAFGNFEFGAAGAHAGISCSTLKSAGNFLHGGQNNPINTTDIVSGFNAIDSGATLTVVDTEMFGGGK
jgi:hypothetical protein